MPLLHIKSIGQLLPPFFPACAGRQSFYVHSIDLICTYVLFLQIIILTGTKTCYCIFNAKQKKKGENKDNNWKLNITAKRVSLANFANHMLQGASDFL